MFISKIKKIFSDKITNIKEDDRIYVKEEDVLFLKDLLGEEVDSFLYGSRIYNMIENALNKAHDIRKFEIELYWKRATYFFAFFTVVTASFGYLFVDKVFFIYAPFLAIVGIFISICFYYVNVGSKYWQCNWEHVIDRLEGYITGSLYKLYFFDSKMTIKPSVSGINSKICVAIIFIWIVAFVASLFQLENNEIFLAVYVTLAFWVFSFAYYSFSTKLKVITESSSELEKEFIYYSLRKPKYKKIINPPSPLI